MKVGDLFVQMSADMARLRTDMGKAVGIVSDSSSRISGALDMVKRAFAAIGGAMVVREFIQMADAMSGVNARLKLATASTEDYAKAQKDVYAIAQRYNTGLAETATLYARLSDPVRKLGGDTRATAGVTEALTAALRISGASSAESSSAILQFSQAMASGTLRGEEFNAVNEAAPRLMVALEQSLGKTRGELREMAKQGELTSDVVANALLKQLGNLQAEASQIPDTVGGAFTQLRNATIKVVGEFDRATGASSTLASAVQAVAGAVTSAGEAASRHGPQIAAVLGALSAGAAVAGVAALAARIGGVVTAIGALGAAAAANPVALALLGLGALAGGLAAYNSSARADGSADGLRRRIAELEVDLRRPASIYRRDDAEYMARWRAQQDAMRTQLKALRAELVAVDAQMLDTRAEDARLAAHASAGRSAGELATQYEALRVRLSGLRGDHQQYQADLQMIQRLRDAGVISERQSVDLLTELAKRHGETAGKTKSHSRAMADASLRASDLGRQLQLENAALQAQEDAYFEAAKQARLFAEAKERAAADEFDRVVADMQPTANALDRWSEQRGEIERVARESHERIAADWQRTADQMSQSLTDALMTGGKNVAEYLKGLFRTLVLRPILAPVSGALAGMITPGAAVAGGGGALGGMGGIGSLLGGVGAFGSYAATGLMSTLTGAGGAAFGAAGSLLGGGSIAGGLGMAAGAAIPYIAAAAAAVKIFDLAFGRKLKDVGIEGGVGAGGFEGGQYRFEKGGWFRSDRTTRSPLAAETEAGLDAAVSALYTSAAEAAEALGLNSDAITGYTESLKISTKGLTDEQVQARLSEFMAQLGENLARQVGLSAERLGSLASALTTVNDILGTFDQRLLQVSVVGGEAAEQLAALFGGVDNLGGALALYAEQFTFAGDNAAYTLDMVTKALRQAGLEVPATRAEFVRLVESQDLMTEAGRRAYAALLGVAGGLDGLYDAAEAAAESTTDLAAATEQRVFDEQRQWQEWARGIADTARTVRDSWRDVVKGIEAAIKKLRGDIVGDNAQAVRAQYASTLQAARGGDRAAIEALPALAQQLSRIGEGTARSALELARLRGTLAADLESVINAARGSSAARSDDMLSMLGRLQWIRVDPATGSYLLGAGGGGGGFSIGGGAPGFASGGLHSGGWRVVGERGPELEATGPSRIHTGDQLGQAMGVDELRDEVRGMRQEMVSMQHAVVRNTSRMAKLLERVIPEGDALQVRTAT